MDHYSEYLLNILEIPYSEFVQTANLSKNLINFINKPENGPSLLPILYSILTSSNFNPPIAVRIPKYMNGDIINASIK